VAPAAPLPLQPVPVQEAAPPAPAAPEAAKPAAHPEERPAPTTVVINSPAAPRATAANTLHDVTLLHAVIAVAAFVLGPLVSLLAVLFLLRRYTARNGPLFRIEFVNNGQGLALVGPGAGAAVETHRVTVPAPAAAAEEPPSTAQRFDLGPTYEEELALRQQAEQQQQEATLRHIFEENMKLREQLETLPEATDEA